MKANKTTGNDVPPSRFASIFQTPILRNTLVVSPLNHPRVLSKRSLIWFYAGWLRLLLSANTWQLCYVALKTEDSLKTAYTTLRDILRSTPLQSSWDPQALKLSFSLTRSIWFISWEIEGRSKIRKNQLKIIVILIYAVIKICVIVKSRNAVSYPARSSWNMVIWGFIQAHLKGCKTLGKRDIYGVHECISRLRELHVFFTFQVF